jgi:hypothetical protein
MLASHTHTQVYRFYNVAKYKMKFLPRLHLLSAAMIVAVKIVIGRGMEDQSYLSPCFPDIFNTLGRDNINIKPDFVFCADMEHILNFQGFSDKNNRNLYIYIFPSRGRGVVGSVWETRIVYNLWPACFN